MSGGRRKRAEEEEELSEPGPSQKQKRGAGAGAAAGSSTQADDTDLTPHDFSQSQQQTSLSPEALTELSNKAVKNVLLLSETMKPFKRPEVLMSAKAKGKNANLVMDEVKRKLLDIFGLNLLEIEHHKYIVINPLQKKLEKYVYEPNMYKTPKRDLLGLLLTIIFVNNMRVQEEKLRECLQKVKVDLQENHPYFGDVNKHVQEFEKQLYIAKEYLTIGSGQVAFFVWGIRAKHEISMNSILEVLAKLYDTTLENLPASLKCIAARCTTEPESMEDFA